MEKPISRERFEQILLKDYIKYYKSLSRRFNWHNQHEVCLNGPDFESYIQTYYPVMGVLNVYENFDEFFGRLEKEDRWTIDVTIMLKWAFVKIIPDAFTEEDLPVQDRKCARFVNDLIYTIRSELEWNEKLTEEEKRRFNVEEIQENETGITIPETIGKLIWLFNFRPDFE